MTRWADWSTTEIGSRERNLATESWSKFYIETLTIQLKNLIDFDIDTITIIMK